MRCKERILLSRCQGRFRLLSFACTDEIVFGKVRNCISAKGVPRGCSKSEEEGVLPNLLHVTFVYRSTYLTSLQPLAFSIVQLPRLTLEKIQALLRNYKGWFSPATESWSGS